MKTILLHHLCTEYCTERTNPGLPELKQQVQAALDSNQNLVIDRSNVKMLTTSFIDQLFSELAIQYSIPKLKQFISFKPDLEEMYWQQVERGVRLRTK